MHIPVMLSEVMTYLAPKAGGHYVDATCGAGGYSQAILKTGCSRLDAFDRDPFVVPTAESLKKHNPRLYFHSQCYSAMGQSLSDFAGKIDGIVFDLGISSMQVDQAERGFSFMREGPLDMRMNPGEGISAAEVVNTMEGADLMRLFRDLGEEPRAKQFAREILKKRAITPFTTTTELAHCIAALCPVPTRTHPATRVFQALRLYVNQELERLKDALDVAYALLKTGGRLVVVTFHSLEDRIVKTFFAQHGKAPATNRHDPALFLAQAALGAKLLTPKVITPTDKEIADNPRARSAKLRALERLSPMMQQQ
jgi:16S rRNA (cytosine1402-N4)-methyltransferase